MAPYAEEGCKLFVYGVNEGTSNSELQTEFEKYGTVTDTYNTGKGYAFVTYDNKDDATEATEQMNGATILGQQIKVNVARPKNNGGDGGYGAAAAPACRQASRQECKAVPKQELHDEEEAEMAESRPKLRVQGAIPRAEALSPPVLRKQVSLPPNLSSFDTETEATGGEGVISSGDVNIST